METKSMIPANYRRFLLLLTLIATLFFGNPILPVMAVDYNRANLVGVDFSGQDLRKEALFDHANLRDSNFSNANVQGVRFFSANLDSANFEGADLRYADLEVARLTKVNFTNAIFDLFYNNYNCKRFPIKRFFFLSQQYSFIVYYCMSY